MTMRNTLTLLFLCIYALTANSQSERPNQPKNSKPFVLAEIHELPSVELGENRTLNIYLPEGYKRDDSLRYPVIYLLDGSADEDFIHIVGLVQYCSSDWVDQLPKSIVVGIATTDRKRDFTFQTTVEADKKLYPTTGHSDRFISFLEKELQPYVERTFKTSSSKTIIGQSLGGLLATEVFLKNPTLFSRYIIISPALWWDNGSILDYDPEIVRADFN